MTTTTDLSQFGYREIAMAGELLSAYAKNPSILEDGVTLTFNPDSGNVFLVDNDDRVAMMNGDNIEEFFYCYEDGHEGFREDFKGLKCKECQRIYKEGYFSG